MPLAPSAPHHLRPGDDGRQYVVRLNPVTGTYDVVGADCHDAILRDPVTSDEARVTSAGALTVAHPNRMETMHETGAAALAANIALGVRWELVCVKLHLSAAGGAVENFTATSNSAVDAVYDTVHFAQDMNAVADIVWVPDKPIPFMATDVLDFAYANSNTRTYGLEVHFRPEV